MRDTLVSLIQSYLNNEIGFDEVEEWYVPKLEILIDKPETSLIVARLELELAELEDGLTTDDEFRDNLKNILKEC